MSLAPLDHPSMEVDAEVPPRAGYLLDQLARDPTATTTPVEHRVEMGGVNAGDGERAIRIVERRRLRGPTSTRISRGGIGKGGVEGTILDATASGTSYEIRTYSGGPGATRRVAGAWASAIARAAPGPCVRHRSRPTGTTHRARSSSDSTSSSRLGQGHRAGESARSVLPADLGRPRPPSRGTRHRARRDGRHPAPGAGNAGDTAHL